MHHVNNYGAIGSQVTFDNNGVRIRGVGSVVTKYQTNVKGDNRGKLSGSSDMITVLASSSNSDAKLNSSDMLKIIEVSW